MERRQGGQAQRMSEPIRYSFYAVLTHHIDGPDTAEIRFQKEKDGLFVYWEDYARLKAEVERLTVCKSGADQLKAKVKRAAKSKPAAKTTPKARGWRKMSTAPLGTPIEVRFAGVRADIRWRTVTAKLDEHGLWIGKVYWARFNALGQDRLDDWRPLSK